MLKVVDGKDRSGFHGTTIQPAFPKPSEKNEHSELIGDKKSLPPTKVGSMLVKKSNTWSVSPALLKSLKEPILNLSAVK